MLSVVGASNLHRTVFLVIVQQSDISTALESMTHVALSDSFLLPALDKTEEEGGGVNWKCVKKLMNFIHTSDCITEDLRYSLKSRLKCKDPYALLNTLTVYHTIALNGTEAVKSQLAGKKCLHRFEKLFIRSKDRIVRHAVLQLLMDWSFLFGNEPLGKRSTRILREVNRRDGITMRPSGLAAEIYELLRGAPLQPTRFFKGFEFEYRDDQIITHQENNCKKISLSCTSTLSPSSLKLGSVKKLFIRGSTKSIPKHSDSAIIRELAMREQPTTPWVYGLLEGIPRDCKNLQDLLSDVQVLLRRGQLDDVQSKMSFAEQLRNKCATTNNTLQEMITTKMKRVTLESDSMEKEEVEPALLRRFLRAGEMLTAVLAEFEHTHIDYIQHLDRITFMSRGNEDQISVGSDHSYSSASHEAGMETEPSQWVDFGSPCRAQSAQCSEEWSVFGSALSGSLTHRPSSREPSTGGSHHCRLPLYPAGNGFPVPKCPISCPSGDRNPPPLPTQSPFADASALLEATRPKQAAMELPFPYTSRSSDEALRSQEGRSSRSDTRSFTPVASSSRSFSELLNNDRRSGLFPRLPVCPALKVRFTDEHLEAVLSQFGQLN